MKCDVLVVGASSAGMMAAIGAARSGSDVILMDRDLRTNSHAANTLFEGMASRAGLFPDSSYMKKTLAGMRIIAPCGRYLTIPATGYFIDRDAFDRRYLDYAEKAGVLLVQEEAFNITLGSGERQVTTGNGEIKAKVVIDASGVQSALAVQAGLSPMRHPEDIAWAAEATVQHPGLGEEEFFSYWIGSMAPGWKATFSPAGGDLATIGVFVRSHGQDVSIFFQRFLEIFKAFKAEAGQRIDQLKIISIRRGGDPIAVLPGEIVQDGFMVTGGAAGQSGLAYGMRAGTICGEVAAEAVAGGDVSKNALSRYESRWIAEFGWEYRIGRAALETLKGMSDRDIDRLVQGLNGRDLIVSGSLYKKLLLAGINIASVKPDLILALARNLARG